LGEVKTKLKNMLKEYYHDYEKRNVLKVMIGEIERSPDKNTTTDMEIKILKVLRKNEIERLKYMNMEESDLTKMIDDLLPKKVDFSEVIEFINSLDISSYKNKMMMMKDVGIKFAGQIDNNEVKKYLETL
jgi:hypothetical protein